MDDTNIFANTPVFREILMRELNTEQRELFDAVIHFDCGCALLKFMHERPREWLMPEDIAFHLKAQVPCVESTLHALVELGLAEQQKITGLEFYSFTARARPHQLADDLCHWQRRWQAALNRLQTLLGHSAPA